MEIVEKRENNNLILGHKPTLYKSTIKFHGKNNRLVCEENVTLLNSQISFVGDNSIIYLSKNKNKYIVRISIPHDSVCFIGENAYFNSTAFLSLSEQKHIFIGNDCIFSMGIWFRVSDAHIIYDSETTQRINPSKSIFIGDHVWFGQDAFILKGTRIGSGSIIGARSLISNKIVNSNTIWGGNPAREIRTNVFFDSTSVHNFREDNTEKFSSHSSDKWIYSADDETLSFDEIDNNFSNIKDVDEKLEYILSIRNNTNHNRFFVDDELLEEQFMELLFGELSEENEDESKE